jgi:hypothetical protein
VYDANVGEHAISDALHIPSEARDRGARNVRWLVLGFVLPALASTALAWLLSRGTGPLLTIHGPSTVSTTGTGGRENCDVVCDVRGWLLECDSHAYVDVITLPEGEHRRIRTFDCTWKHSEPDVHGRFAYVCDAGSDRAYQVRIADVNGESDRVLIERRGHVPWGRLVSWVSLSPRDSSLLIASRREPATYQEMERMPYELELWNIDSGEHESLGAMHCRDGAWLADGHRAVLEIRARPSQVDHEPVPRELLDRSAGSGQPDDAPSIQLLDIDTHTLSWIGWGLKPRASPDGSTIVYALSLDTCVVYDVATRTSDRVSLPALYGCPEALLSERVIAYPAREKTEESLLRDTSMMPAVWTLRATNIESREFTTLAPSIGRIHRFTFGVRGS